MNGARDLGLPVGAGNDGAPDLSGAPPRDRSGPGARALRVRPRARPDRSAMLSWVVAARQSGKLSLLVYQGVLMTELARGGRHRAAGLGVGREGRHLHERSGPRAAGGEGLRRARRRAGRPRHLLARGARRSGQPLPWTSAAEVRAAIAAHLKDNPAYAALGIDQLLAARHRQALAAGVESRPSAGSGTSCSRKSTRRSGTG